MAETEGRDPDSGPTESNGGTDQRHERDPISLEQYLGKRSTEKAVVRYDIDTRFWQEKMQQMRDAEMKSNETESRSTEETKGKNFDIGPRESGRSSVEKAAVRYDRDTRFWEENREYLESGPRENLQQRERLRDPEMQQRRSRETESRFFQQKNREYERSGSRMNEAGPIRDHNESYIRESRGFGMQQRRSHETESRFQQQKRATDFDWRGSPEWGRSESERRFDEESSVYETRTRVKKRGDCHFYLKKGWCGYGRDCVFNHPSHFPRSWRFDEGTQRKYETEESRYIPEKMARTVYGRGSGSTWRFDEERQGTESGYGEAQENTLEQRDNIWWQTREAPETVREQGQGQRDSTGRQSYHERKSREAQEIPVNDPQKQRLVDLATREMRFRLARRREQEQEQEQRDGERQVTNKAAQNRESSQEFGTERKEGGGI